MYEEDRYKIGGRIRLLPTRQESVDNEGLCCIHTHTHTHTDRQKQTIVDFRQAGSQGPGDVTIILWGEEAPKNHTTVS